METQPLTREEVTEVVKAVSEEIVQKTALSYDQLNEGACGQVAWRAKDRLDRETRPTEAEIVTNDDYNLSWTFSHTWIRWNGLHFDAHNPEGVERPEDLDFFDHVDQ